MKTDFLRQRAEHDLDNALRAIGMNAETILAAHCDLGLPLEDVICAAVRKALTARAADGDRQLNLLFAGERPASASTSSIRKGKQS